MASFRKRGNKWQYRVSYIDPITQKRLEVSKGGFRTKPEAVKSALEHEHALKTGEAVITSRQDLKEYLEYWLKKQRLGQVAINTYKLDKNSIYTHILPYFQKVKLNAIKPRDYVEFLEHLSEKGKSKRTIEIIHNTFYKATEDAIHPFELINKNPAKNIKIPNKNNNKKKDKLKFLDTSKIDEFLFEARKDNWIYFVYFKTLVETGMRKGEAAALQWTDIDFENRRIDINKSLDFQAEDDSKLFGDTKTYKSRRKIKVLPDLLEELKKQKEVVKENKEVFKDVYKDHLDLVFCRDDGNFLPKSTLFNAFRRILSKIRTESMPIHGLRHTHAVWLLESGARMKYIQERLGHKSMEITADIYSHVSEKIEDDDLEKFAQYKEESKIKRSGQSVDK